MQEASLGLKIKGIYIHYDLFIYIFHNKHPNCKLQKKGKVYACSAKSKLRLGQKHMLVQEQPDNWKIGLYFYLQRLNWLKNVNSEENKLQLLTTCKMKQTTTIYGFYAELNLEVSKTLLIKSECLG